MLIYTKATARPMDFRWDALRTALAASPVFARSLSGYKAAVSEICARGLRLSLPCSADSDLWRISARTKLYVCLWDSEKYAKGSQH